jgi:hypothetical protein
MRKTRKKGRLLAVAEIYRHLQKINFRRDCIITIKMISKSKILAVLQLHVEKREEESRKLVAAVRILRRGGRVTVEVSISTRIKILMMMGYLYL